MVIRVDSKSIESRQGHLTAGVEARRPADVAPADVPQARRAADRGAQLSEASARLKSIEQKLAAEAPFDAQRVAEIKAEIREGRYKIHPEKIADAIIVSAVLLGKKRESENH